MTQPPRTLTKPPLPDEANSETQVARMIRVNQAGEYGAKRIYEGQLSTIKDPASRREIEHMLAQELPHLEYFNQAMNERRVRPTLLQPLWHVGGFALGAITAKMGSEAAMACTAAVESVIEEHYGEQEEALGEKEKALKGKISQFRAEEQEHHHTAIEHGAENVSAYPLLSFAIRGVTRTAIALSKKI